MDDHLILCNISELCECIRTLLGKIEEIETIET